LINGMKKPIPVILLSCLKPFRFWFIQVRGWCNYYSAACSTDTFAKMKDILYHKLMYWAKRRHSNKPVKWVVRKYWRLENGTWDFAVKDGIRLKVHTEVPIKRHIKVRGTKSPFDGDQKYWGKRGARLY